MSAIKLAVRDVKKTFRVRGSSRAEDAVLNVLGGVSFDARDGEIVSLIGESGCGKTTLLRIIQGLTKLDAGTVSIDGVPFTRSGTQSRARLSAAQSAARGVRPSPTSSSAWN